MKLIDTHIHLDLMENPSELLEEARLAGIGAWVVPGVSPSRWDGLMSTVDMYDGLYAAPGVHPQYAQQCGRCELETLAQLLEHPRAVAIGEVGLDRRVETLWETQEEVFIAMIHLAREMDKPLLIHARRSTERLLELLSSEGGGDVRGILHAFSGSVETALKAIDLNFALGIGGVVTYPTARRLPQVVRAVPAEALVLETDAPDMTPEPYRGRTNRPAWLHTVAETVAELREWSYEETVVVTSANAKRILGLAKIEF